MPTITTGKVAVDDPLVDEVTIAVHKPRQRSGIAVLLTHGAGGTLDTPGLVGLADVIARLGHVVVRVNLPHREAGRKSSPRADRVVGPFTEVARAVAGKVDADHWVLGGKSYGGRVATMAVAEGAEALGLFCYGYPLHPPGKPEKLRVEHWPDVDIPVAILQGARDSFGTPDEFEPHIKKFPRRTTMIVVAGGDHSCKVTGKNAPDGRPRNEAAAIAEQVDHIQKWFNSLT